MVKTHRGEDRIIRFLKGLNESYASVRSQIMLIEPMPNMSIVFSLVVQQERQLNSGESESRALEAGSNWKREESSERSSSSGRGSTDRFGRGSFKGSNPSTKTSWAKNGKYCTHCKKTGHTMDVCYRLHGFPANFRFTRNQHANSATTAHSDQRKSPLLDTFI
ncbi:hypothetical protein Lal_00026485 [Lupinus albus]|nr:hypothetical protein Lal_00026485 [Lupinus albus]